MVIGTDCLGRVCRTGWVVWDPLWVEGGALSDVGVILEWHEGRAGRHHRKPGGGSRQRFVVARRRIPVDRVGGPEVRRARPPISARSTVAANPRCSRRHLAFHAQVVARTGRPETAPTSGGLRCHRGPWTPGLGIGEAPAPL